MNRTVLRSSVAGALVAMAAWVYFGPYVAARSLQSAVEARDSTRISEHVNFPALRESLKASVMSKLTTEATKSNEGGAFAALGVALVSSMIGPLIDAMVSPEGLANMLKGEKPKPDNPPAAADDASSGIERSSRYESLDRFVVTIKKKGEPDSMGFVFAREGLFNWKLSAVRLP